MQQVLTTLLTDKSARNQNIAELATSDTQQAPWMDGGQA